MAEQSLKDKTVKGVAWSAIDNVVQFSVTFLVGIVLARLLSPDDYGLIGLIGIFTAVCTTIINGGMVTALIRTKDAKDEDYNTAFIINLSLSAFLYIVLFLCAPFISVFFDRQELSPLIRVSSIGMIIGGLALVQRVRLTKRVDFKSQAKITLLSSLSSAVVGISMALLGCGVWALVFQHLSNMAVNTCCLWVVNKWIPKIRFSIDSFHRLFGFGWKMMVSSMLNTLWNELYQAVVGKYYSPATLGQYTRSYQFSSLFSSNLTTVIQRVTYPVLSNIQDNKERMIPAYRRIIKMTMFIAAIPMFFLGAISEPLLYCLIGPKWHEAATYLPIICVSSSLYPLHAINLNMLQVQGRSDLYLSLEIIKKIIALPPLFLGAFIGIFPMLYAGLVVGIISYFLNSYYSGKKLGYSSWEQMKDISTSYFIAIMVSLTVYFFKYLPFSYWLILPIQIFVGVIILISLCKAMKNPEYLELESIALSYVSNLGKKI